MSADYFGPVRAILFLGILPDLICAGLAVPVISA